MNILTRILHRGMTSLCHPFYRNVHKTAIIDHRVIVYNKKNIVMEEHTNIDAKAIIMNTKANFVMKRYSGAAVGLTVITGGHLSIPGVWFKDVTNAVKKEYDTNGEFDKDIIVEEEVWIGANVTLLKGVILGRGCEVGTNTVVRNSVPPYGIVIGNPAKIVGFKFTPEEVIKHEKELYPEGERLPLELLEKNYDKFFIKRIKEIKEFTRL